VAPLGFTVRQNCSFDASAFPFLTWIVRLTAQDSLQYLPLADATILNLLAPLGASFLTSKRSNLIQIGSAIVCFFGVGLIAKPNFMINLLHHDTGSRHLAPSPDFAGSSSYSDWRGFVFAMVGVAGGVVRFPLSLEFSCFVDRFGSVHIHQSQKSDIELILWPLQIALQQVSC
jgi:drug/metabolite transporter (DMT)-like permease